MPAAGTLDRQLTILRRVQTGVSDANEPVFNWPPFLTVWAAKIHKSEDEAYAASQRYARRAVTFQTHFLDDLLETDKLVCEGVTYDVKGFRELGRRAGTEISAEAVDLGAE